MKKRARILVSLLMISGSLTLTSKSYAESEPLDFLDDAWVRLTPALITSCVGTSAQILGGLTLAFDGPKSILAANRFYKLGAKGAQTLLSISMVSSSLWAAGCGASLLISFQIMKAAVNASRIVANPALAMNNEDFRLLVESVGYEVAFSLIERIANGEDLATVVNSLSSVLAQTLNTEKDSFPGSGYEEELGAQ